MAIQARGLHWVGYVIHMHTVPKIYGSQQTKSEGIAQRIKQHFDSHNVYTLYCARVTTVQYRPKCPAKEFRYRTTYR